MPKIAVIGAGTMGNGIAQVFAGQGNDVILVDVQQAALDKGMKAIEGSLARVVKKGTLTEAAAAVTLKRIALATDLAVVKDAALVVEAASEDPAIKFKISRELDLDRPCCGIGASAFGHDLGIVRAQRECRAQRFG